jgi:RimJ/RimL family protein N-acetyltransferase
VTEAPVIQTERLRMRGWRFEDYEPLAEILADPAVGAGLGKPDGLTPYEAWLDMSVVSAHWSLRGFGNWALEDRESGEFLGRAGLYYPPDWPAMEVGWTVARKHWGKGYAPEAARAACRWAHAELATEQSIRVAEKLGENLEGRHSTRGFDLLVYGTDLPLSDSPR